MDLVEECKLLGASLIGAQKIEFTLYGIASHITHAYDGKKDRRIEELTPEKFLRGDLNELKMTLGQLEKSFGHALLLDTEELAKFVEDRNLIAHNYWRLTKTNIKGSEKLQDPETFLREFLKRCSYWEGVVNGALWSIRKMALEQYDRSDEFEPTIKQRDEITQYLKHVEKAVLKRVLKEG